ncbi:NTE family protein [Luteibacter rhizovicinus]|uniref:NTE family protein n=1 Tax=Luteibacter rhizovicinus TaxID=242606 RepID=A0A4R3YMW0_9GAMM|nr:patatin-like phospholipase family protein [Luteibacter rhizovicinus]TCV92838.1 NTE family protein [Luteibacter rhizovicinus]
MLLPHDVDALIERSGTFGHLGAGARSALARRLIWLSLPGGATLFVQGEPSDGMYLLRSGSLASFAPDGSTDHLIVAGGIVGDVGQITGDCRRRTVRALRDSELLWLPSAAFAGLAADHASVLLATARTAVRRLRDSLADQRAGSPRTFAVLAHDPGVPARAFATRLVQALAEHGRSALIGPEHGLGRSGAWFAEREAELDYTVYLDTEGQGLWRNRCRRQADALLLPVLAAQQPAAWPEDWTRMAPDHRPHHLVLIHPGHDVAHGAAARWAATLAPATRQHHVRAGADIDRIARLVSGNGRGLVLAGGGARGMAHLGALRALGEAGHTFDAVGGTSIGAIIAAGVAMGWPVERMAETMREAFVSGRPLSDWTLPLVALTRGHRATRMLRRTFGAIDIEDLPIPYFCVSTSLSGEGKSVHREGPLWLWLRATSAIPGVLPPVTHGGGVFVDGALVDNLPTDVMRDDGIGHITAVDIRAGTSLTASIDEAISPSPWHVWFQRRRGIVRPSLVSTLVRAAMVNAEAASAERRALADLLLSPPLEHIGMLDWGNWRRAVDAGYAYTAEALNQPL